MFQRLERMEFCCSHQLLFCDFTRTTGLCSPFQRDTLMVPFTKKTRASSLLDLQKKKQVVLKDNGTTSTFLMTRTKKEELKETEAKKTTTTRWKQNHLLRSQHGIWTWS